MWIVCIFYFLRSKGIALSKFLEKIFIDAKHVFQVYIRNSWKQTSKDTCRHFPANVIFVEYVSCSFSGSCGKIDIILRFNNRFQ